MWSDTIYNEPEVETPHPLGVDGALREQVSRRRLSPVDLTGAAEQSALTAPGLRLVAPEGGAGSRCVPRLIHANEGAQTRNAGQIPHV